MKRQQSVTAITVAFLTCAVLALSSATAANLNRNPEPQAGPQESAIDLANYRSTSGRHKVRIDGGPGDALKRSATSRVLDYGSFQVLELDRATADRLLASGNAENADAQNLVLLNTGAIDTTSPSAIELGTQPLAVSGGKQLHLVQFPGPIRPEWMTLLESTGVQVVTPIPNNAYLLYGDDRALSAVAGLATTGVLQWQAAYLPQYKLQPGTETQQSATQLKSLALKQPVGPTDLYQVQLVRDPVVNAITETFLRDIAGARPPRSRYEILSYVNLVVQIPATLLAEAAKRSDVVSIARYIEPTLHDERQNMIMAGNLTGNVPNPGNYLTTLANWGFTQTQFNTSGFVVDVTDDGADRNPGAADPGTIPQDSNSGPFNPRHFALYEGGSTTAATRFRFKSRWGAAVITDGGFGYSGHGQLNMSIVGGFVPDSFDTSNTRVHRDAQGFRFGLGVAPFVRMGNSVIFDPRYTSPAFPAMLSANYSSNARISSNSWGASVNGEYNANSQAYDALVRDSQSATAGNQPMIIVFSAGNDGPSATTIGSPGTAKNVITVGATENVRSHSESNGGDVGNAVGNDGCMSSDTEADSANDMATFSSRGPTKDGRSKPDVVAPGTHVTGISFVAANANALSPLNGLGAADAGFRADGVCGMPNKATVPANKFFPVNPAQRWYTTSSGTSHSAPAVAGGAALVYQQFINNPPYLASNRTPPGSAPPSPALVKAYLANTARYMNGAGANDSLPSNSQGMGSVNLGTAFDSVPRIIRDQVVSDGFTASGQVRTFIASVTNASAPLRVTLAYTDVPGPTTGNAFINNLDLRVIVNGNTYLGNVFSGAASVTGGVADTRNNLESVFLPAGLAVGSIVAIQVRATNIAGVADPTVAGNNQDFALVAYNATPAPDQAVLVFASSSLPTGNNAIEPNECNDLNVTLINEGLFSATAVNATLATSSPGVTVTRSGSAYPTIAAGANGGNLTPFQISTASSLACGSVVNFTQTVSFTGGAAPVSFPLSFIVGTPVILFSQNFDAVAAPALPAGWTTAQTGTTPPAIWATTATNPDTPANAAFTNGSATAATNSLISPPIVFPASPTNAVLSFRHAWAFESGGTYQFDGGILELSTDGGTTYNNVTSPSVGGSFTAGGYTGIILNITNGKNPIAGQAAWGGAQATFVTSTLVLPTALNGQTIRLRWRAGWDEGIAAPGPNWRIDTLSLQAGYSCGGGSGACVAPTASVTRLRSSLNPSTFGTSVTLGALVTGSSPLPGTVNFFDGGLPLSTGTLSGGSAIYASNALSVGSHNVTATYVGDAKNTTSTGALTQVVNKANQAIVFGSPPSVVVGGTGTVSAAGGATGNAVSFTSTTTTVCTVSGATVTGVAPGSCIIAANQLGNGNYNAAAQQTLAFSIAAPPILDIDDSAPATQYDAATDGVLLIRYLLGYRDAALITGAISPSARRNAAQIAAHIEANRARFDVDGDGATLATTDGVMILRRLLGITDPAAITQGAKNSTRSNANVVLAIDALKP